MGIEALITSADSFSFFNLFLKADIVVKIVMVILGIASIWSWTIIIEKFINLSLIKYQKKKFESVFWSGLNINELKEKLLNPAKDPFARIFSGAMREWEENRQLGVSKDLDVISAQNRVERAVNLSLSRDLNRLESGIGILAVISSSAPFIGLLGTVWGIMNSFRAIATSQNTNLAVVAPGIAEALFATALGLFAAIPAVIFYNIITGKLSSYTVQLENYADELITILSKRFNVGNQS